MDSEPVVDTYVDENERSSPSPSSDSDAVNTPKARVYFGPVQSAEKKRAQLSNVGQPTPVRRSARHSTVSMLHMNIQEASGSGGGEPVSEEEKSDQSRGESPDLLEEPPSALATKVLRAWDNPSPPPSPTAKAVTLQTPDELQTSEPISIVTSEGDEDEGRLAAQTSDDPSAVDVQILLSGKGTNAAVEVAGDSSVDDAEEDLIMFDSFGSPNTGPRMRAMPATPVRTHVTVDDLLAISPMPALTSTGDNSAIIDPAITIDIPQDGIREETPSVFDEQEVAFTLSDVPIPSHISPPAELQPPVVLNESQVEAPLVLLTPTPDPVTQTPPIRRSTRSRRSVSPFIAALTKSPSKATSEITTDLNTPQSRAGSAVRRRRKIKPRDVETEETPVPQELEGHSYQHAVSQASAKTEDASTIPPANSLLEDLTAALANETISEAASRPIPTTVTDTQVNLVEEPDRPSTPKSTQRARRLGSLSPTSSQVLDQLAPCSSSSSLQGSADTQPDNTPVVPSAFSSFLFTPPPIFGRDSTVSGSEIPSTLPSTPLRPPPPSRVQELTRTPARRVPITEAVAKGSISPEKARTLLVQRPDPSFAVASSSFLADRVFNDHPRSPAKRVPVQDGVKFLQSPQKGKVPLPSFSPARERSRSVDVASTPGALRVQRSSSVEPRIPLLKTIKEDSSRKQALPDGHSKHSEPGPSLPFPIHSFTSTRLPTSIAEAEEAEPQSSQSKITPTPAPKPTPSLRQPTVKAESKIPRPGTKPYARPARVGAIAGVSRVPTPSVAKKVDASTPAAPVAARPMRMVRRVSTKPVTVESSSDNDSTQPVPGPGPKTMAHRAATFPSSITDDPAVTSLKRKREFAEVNPSTAGAKPVVIVGRRVVSAASANKAGSGRPTRSSPSPAKRASPAKPSTVPSVMHAKVRMRKVENNRKLPAVTPSGAAAPSQGPGEASTVDSGSATATSSKALPSFVEIMSSPVAPGHDHLNATVASPPSATATAFDTSGIPAEQLDIQGQNRSQGVSAHEPEPEAEGAGLRRTTRSRRSAQSPTDVFGTVVPTSRSRPKPKIFVDEGPFSHFSQVQLKTLTSKNTEWNQKQFSALSTQVIMKEGKRPESPTTKVRNILDQQREEKNQQRQDRAARRARKSAGTDDELLEPGDEDAVNVGEDAGEPPMTHRRGPGDEEDYHTPEKERPLKRTRFDGVATENWDSRQEKRVKWDRGLFQTVYLTDTPPNPKRPPKVELTKKGCLSTAAKSLPLDTMGNVLNAEKPVADIAPESIVVQKFVYEDDADVQAEQSSPAKSTRSKSKKAKT